MTKKSRNQKPKNVRGNVSNEQMALPDENPNQNHNTKKVSLGPNTKR